jgi:hypothetical protein
MLANNSRIPVISFTNSRNKLDGASVARERPYNASMILLVEESDNVPHSAPFRLLLQYSTRHKHSETLSGLSLPIHINPPSILSLNLRPLRSDGDE